MYCTRLKIERNISPGSLGRVTVQLHTVYSTLCDRLAVEGRFCHCRCAPSDLRAPVAIRRQAFSGYTCLHLPAPQPWASLFFFALASLLSPTSSPSSSLPCPRRQQRVYRCSVQLRLFPLIATGLHSARPFVAASFASITLSKSFIRCNQSGCKTPSHKLGTYTLLIPAFHNSNNMNPFWTVTHSQRTPRVVQSFNMTFVTAPFGCGLLVLLLSMTCPSPPCKPSALSSRCNLTFPPTHRSCSILPLPQG